MKRQYTITRSSTLILPAVAVLLTVLILFSNCHSPQNQMEEMNNKSIVRKAFESWAASEGNFFDLLAEDVVWTITGSSPVSKTYNSRKQFIDEVITPLNKRLSQKIVPELKGLYAYGDMVVALWVGKAMRADGRAYNNTYSWYMKIKEGKIIEVVAFFDSKDFTSVWELVPVPPDTMR